MPYRFEDRRSEIIYKLKEKPVYFLLEHQSTIDKNMPLRIWEYIGEIMRRENRIQNRIGKEETRKIKSKEPDEKIMKYTGITKEELEELKGEVIYS